MFIFVKKIIAMFRQIITPKNTQLLLQLPEEFVGHPVEVIAFQVEQVESDTRKIGSERHSQQERLTRLMKFIKSNPIKLPKGYTFNRNELYE